MYLIVLGAEVEGRRLIDIAVEQGHEVTLIEKDEEKARLVLKAHSIRVLNGTIVDKDILKEATVNRAEAVIATTYDDAQNLMAMVLAKEYGIEQRISLLNQSSHAHIFEHLGIKVVNDPAAIIARQLFEFLD
ncbi:MAG: NAD-binding protein [Cyanobacteria bacterium J06607_13]